MQYGKDDEMNNTVTRNDIKVDFNIYPFASLSFCLVHKGFDRTWLPGGDDSRCGSFSVQRIKL